MKTKLLIMKKEAKKIQFEQTVDKFRSAIAQLEDIVKLMPTKGYTGNDCQKTCVLEHINNLDHCINGIELEDFTKNEYSQDFKLSY